MSEIVELVTGKRVKGETKDAVIACNDWLRLGAGRSLVALVQGYREAPRNTAPTTSLNTLQKWSQSYGWQDRAEAYDAVIEAQKEERRKQLLEEGLALDFERVDKLRRVAEFLEGQIFYTIETDTAEQNASVTTRAAAAIMAQMLDDEGGSDTVVVRHERLDPNDPRAKYPNVWARDVKGLGRGDNFRTVELVRFNAAIFSEFRAALDDIAKEVGGRKTKVEHSGDKENPLQHAISYIREVRPPVTENGDDE